MDAKRFNKLIKKLNVAGSDAYEKIYKAFNIRLRLRLWIKYRNKELSEDITHDFFAGFKKMKFPEYIENPMSWLLICCNNIAKNKIKKEGREILVENNVALDLSENSKQYEYEIYGDYTDKLNKLDLETKTIISKKVFEEYTLLEIADDMNLNYATVRQKYSRGLKKLKKLKKM